MTASLSDLLYSTGEWSWLARDGWRCVSLAQAAAHMAEGPPLRRPRTALPLLGPWAPATLRIATQDGRTVYVDSDGDPLTDGGWILYAPRGA